MRRPVTAHACVVHVHRERAAHDELAGIDETTTFGKGDSRNIVPRSSPEARKANRGLVELLGSIAVSKKATPAPIALAWDLARRPWIVPIPGTAKVARMKENLAAADLGLTAADLRRIDDALAQIKIQGDRHPAHLAARVGK